MYEFDKAIRLTSELISCDQNMKDIETVQALIIRSSAHEKKQNYLKALTDLQNAAQIRSNIGVGYINNKIDKLANTKNFTKIDSYYSDANTRSSCRGFDCQVDLIMDDETEDTDSLQLVKAISTLKERFQNEYMQSSDQLEIKFDNNSRQRSISLDEMELRNHRLGTNISKKSPKNFIRLFVSSLLASSFKVQAFVYFCASLYVFVLYKFGKYIMSTKMFHEKVKLMK